MPVPRFPVSRSKPEPSATPRPAGRTSPPAATRGAAPDKPKRVEQMRAAYRLAAAADPRLPIKVFGPALAVLAVLVVVGVLIGQPVYLSVLGVVAALLVGVSVFGRKANAAMFAQVEGQPGAAAAVLKAMRGDWRVTPAVAVTRSYDLVHRAVGRPGVVLVGEGSPARLRELISQEKRRIGRVAPDTPVYDVIVGTGDGQVTIQRLQAHVMRLPRNLRGKQVDALEARMRALGGGGLAAMPKGPLPRTPRPPRGGRIR
jgi:xanthosine utilization system XapX-like protein